jgi:hypothetical protein
MKMTEHLPAWMEQAIWVGDEDTLRERAGCICCCDRHSYVHCPARLWGGCRGQDTSTKNDLDEWEKFVEKWFNNRR